MHIITLHGVVLGYHCLELVVSAVQHEPDTLLLSFLYLSSPPQSYTLCIGHHTGTRGRVERLNMTCSYLPLPSEDSEYLLHSI